MQKKKILLIIFILVVKCSLKKPANEVKSRDLRSVVVETSYIIIIYFNTNN